jgi:hypothetical protein
MSFFDEMYDEMLHDEFRTDSRRDARVASRPARAAGLARYRTAALVGAGGMACAAAGALLGGLGGYFTLSPASAHAVTSSHDNLPLAAAANTAYHPAAVAGATDARPAAGGRTVSDVTNRASGSGATTFATAAGPLLNGSTPLTAPSATQPITSPSGGTPSAGSPGGQVTQIVTAGLTEVLDNLTQALSEVTTLPTNRGGLGTVTSLTGDISDVTGTLSNLSRLMPVPSALSTGTLPVLSAAAPTSAPATTAGSAHVATAPDRNSTPSPKVSALTSVLSGGAAATSGSTASGLAGIPSLPLLSGGSASARPSLPLTSPTGTLPSLPEIPLPLPPVVSNSGGSTCVTVPSLTKTLSVGLGSNGDSSGATVCVPS